MRSGKVIVTDIDYTLTDANLRLNTRAVEKIRRLETKGVRVILMSGRNISTTGSLAQFVGTCGFVGAESGGVIARYQLPIRILGRVERARAALRLLKRRMGRKVVERPDSRYGLRLSDVSMERSFELEEAARMLRKTRMKVQLVDTGVTFQLMDVRVNKGRALEELARQAGFRLSNAVAIGDNYNDLSLFRKAGYSVAVENAPDAVKECADYVCKHSYGQGFLEAVDKTVS
jgi:phosphoglycolate phosphatase (TIGR01487 family)